MRFAILNNVPPGFCRKMHLLAPGGRLGDLAELTRDDLPKAGLSPTLMEAIEGLGEWRRRGISPTLGLVMWFLESEQLDSGGFLRTEEATTPSVGVAIRYLQIAGQNGITRDECESVDRAAGWLERQIDDDGLIRIPITGVVDHGTLARSIRSLRLVDPSSSENPVLTRGCSALADANIGPGQWPTYPGGRPSTGATSLALAAIADCPEHFEITPDARWLLECRNSDGGWAEYPGSPSRADNTFWAGRACTLAGQEVADLGAVVPSKPVGSYDVAMAQRLRVLAGGQGDEQAAEAAIRSLNDDADRYAETVLLGLAVSEAEQVADAGLVAQQALPIRTPDFLRREPPLYDQLADISGRRRWLGLVERAAGLRVAESSIGWLAGLSAAIAMIGEELVNGLAALSIVPLVVMLVVESMLVAGWLAARQSRHRRFNGVPHFALAVVLAVLLVLLIKAPPEVEISFLPTVILTILLSLIIEVISVATDKADLLNRLGDD
ncbi:MAG: prenyltransferase/squalene oxidase repeat-containing protein [Actinomycetota bacterium]